MVLILKVVFFGFLVYFENVYYDFLVVHLSLHFLSSSPVVFTCAYFLQSFPFGLSSLLLTRQFVSPSVVICGGLPLIVFHLGSPVFLQSKRPWCAMIHEIVLVWMPMLVMKNDTAVVTLR